MTYYFYKFTGKVKLCQMLPCFFSRNFFFLFSDKNLLSFWGCEEIFSFSNLLSRKSPKLGRFFYNNFLFVRAAKDALYGNTPFFILFSMYQLRGCCKINFYYIISSLVNFKILTAVKLFYCQQPLMFMLPFLKSAFLYHKNKYCPKVPPSGPFDFY